MATPTHHLESSLARRLPIYEQWDLEDDRIIIDIETSKAMAHKHRKSAMRIFMERLLHELRPSESRSIFDNRTVGPAFLLVFLVLVWVFSQYFPPGLRAYLLALR
jgi:hypothetical protein